MTDKERLEEIFNLESIKEKLVDWQTEESMSTKVDFWPLDIRRVEWLVERVQELEEEIKKIRDAYDERLVDINWYQNMLGIDYEEMSIELPIERVQGEKIKRLEKQNKRYREALEFYANRDNYKLEHFDPNLDDYMSTVDYDEGHIARQALEESK